MPPDIDPPTANDVRTALNEACHALHNQTIDNIANEFLLEDRQSGLQAANRKARQIVEDAWTTLDGRIGIVSGKELISRMSTWAQQRYQASFGVNTLLNTLRADDVIPEVQLVIRAIEDTTQTSLPAVMHWRLGKQVVERQASTGVSGEQQI